MSKGFGQLFTDTLIYGFGRYLNALATLFLVPLFTRLLPPDQYGLMELLNALIATLTVISVLGLDSALAMLYYDQADEAGREAAAATALTLRGGVAVIVGLGGFLAAPHLATTFFHAPEAIGWLRGVFLAYPMFMIQQYALDYLRLRHMPWRYLGISLGTVAVTLGLSLLFVWGLGRGVEGVAWALTLSYLVGGVAGLALIHDGLRPVFATPLARRMLAFGLPLLPASMAGWVIGFSDRYVLNHFVSLAELGIYALGLKFGAVMGLVTSSFQLAWGPFAFSVKHQENAPDLYRRVLNYFLAGTMVLAVGLGLFAPEITQLVASPRYQAAAGVGAIALLAPIMTGAYYIVALGVNLAAKTAYISLTTMLAAAVSVALNLLLVPRLGILGAALVSVLAQAVSALAVYAISQRVHRIPFDGWRAVAIVGTGALVLALGTQLPAGFWQIAAKLGLLGAFLLALAGMKVVARADLARIIAMVRTWRGRAGSGAASVDATSGT